MQGRKSWLSSWKVYVFFDVGRDHEHSMNMARTWQEHAPESLVWRWCQRAIWLVVRNPEGKVVYSGRFTIPWFVLSTCILSKFKPLMLENTLLIFPRLFFRVCEQREWPVVVSVGRIRIVLILTKVYLLLGTPWNDELRQAVLYPRREGFQRILQLLPDLKDLPKSGICLLPRFG